MNPLTTGTNLEHQTQLDLSRQQHEQAQLQAREAWHADVSLLDLLHGAQANLRRMRLNPDQYLPYVHQGGVYVPLGEVVLQGEFAVDTGLARCWNVHRLADLAELERRRPELLTRGVSVLSSPPGEPVSPDLLRRARVWHHLKAVPNDLTLLASALLLTGLMPLSVLLLAVVPLNSVRLLSAVGMCSAMAAALLYVFARDTEAAPERYRIRSKLLGLFS